MSKELDFYSFIEERLNIYILKTMKQPFPWTKDETLQKHKFCNSQRHLDAGTQKLLEYVIENNNLTLKQKILNIVFYRMFNSKNHFEIFGLIDNCTQYEYEQIINKCESCIREDIRIFNNAYAIRAPKPKYKNIINALTKVNYNRILYTVRNSSPEESIKVIKNEVKHCGDFIAGQIYIDCTYNIELCPRWTGDNFLIIGPGALEGLRLMYGEDFEGRDPESIIRHLWEQQPKFKNIQNYPNNSNYINGRLSLMDIQHCLCEYRKYLKWQKGEGMCRLYRRD